MASVTPTELDQCKASVELQVKGWIDSHADDEHERYIAIEKQLANLTSKVDAIMNLFEQSKGALKIIKWLAYGSAAAWAFVVWAKDHIRV